MVDSSLALAVLLAVDSLGLEPVAALYGQAEVASEYRLVSRHRMANHPAPQGHPQSTVPRPDLPAD